MSEICSEEEIFQLVHAFYSKVRGDALLGPVFELHVTNWDQHLAKMITFWSSALRGTRNYRGTPMPVHMVLPGLTHCMFERWLDLFFETTRGTPNQAMGQRATEYAQQVGQGLWHGYQFRHDLGEAGAGCTGQSAGRPAGRGPWIPD